MTTSRLFTPAFGALFAAALVFFTSGSTVLPVASRFAAGPLGASAIIASGGGVLLLVRRGALVRPVAMAPSRLPG